VALPARFQKAKGSPVPRNRYPSSPLALIRFTRQAFRQCRASGGSGVDRRVCDAVVNGLRTPVGGSLVSFCRRRPGARRELRVLGRVTPGGCLVLQVVSGLGLSKKSRKIRDF